MTVKIKRTETGVCACVLVAASVWLHTLCDKHPLSWPGESLKDELPWCKFSGITWLPDSSGLFYARYDKPASLDSVAGKSAGTEVEAAKGQKVTTGHACDGGTATLAHHHPHTHPFSLCSTAWAAAPRMMWWCTRTPFTPTGALTAPCPQTAPCSSSPPTRAVTLSRRCTTSTSHLVQPQPRSKLSSSSTTWVWQKE